MKIPWGTPTVSSATAIGYTNLEQSILGLLHQAVITENFATLDAWTVADSGGNINLVGGVVSMNGSNSYTANGIKYTGGIARGVGYLECKVKFTTIANSHMTFGLATTDIYPIYNSLLCFNCDAIGGSFNVAGSGMSIQSIVADTWYTIRFYINGLTNDGSTWRKVRITIQGGTFTTESQIYEADKYYSATQIPTTMYVGFQRYLNNAASLDYIKEFRWYSGYSAASPYIEWIADAGAGKTWQNFDRTAIAFDAGFPTTNMTFSDSFDDGVESYSVAANLATWQAGGKTTANRRYIRLRAYLVSDGATAINAPVCGPNSDTATDIKDYSQAQYEADNTDPGVSFVVREADGGPASYKIRGVTKTPAFNAAAYALAVEAARNTALSMSVVKLGEPVRQFGVDDLGEYNVTYPQPTAPVLTAAAASATAADLAWDFGAMISYFEAYYRVVGAGTWTKWGTTFTGGSTQITGLTAATAYEFKVVAYNPAALSGVDSNTVSISTMAVADLPDEVIVGQLLDSIRAAILEIPGFLSENVIIGEINDLDTRDTTTGFPCVEIFPANKGGNGRGYESQRVLNGSYAFSLFAHHRTATADRNTGTDMKTIARYGSAILRQIFRFNDNAQNGNPPCDGFVMVEPEYNSTPAYEQFSENVNSEIMQISIRADSEDTEL